MSIVPPSISGKLSFYEAHFPVWTGNALSIGLTAEQVTALGTLIDAARTAFDNAEIARNASKSATLALHDAINAMHADPDAGADMIAQIKNFAQSTDNPNVYVLADIPAPATPTPAPAPGRPFDFDLGLTVNGAPILSWKCDNPAGTMNTRYEVRRRIGGAGEDVLIGASGERTFTDTTLPNTAATAVGGVRYTITAVRGGLSGTSAAVTLEFGTNTGSGGMGVSIATTDGGGQGVKLAA